MLFKEMTAGTSFQGKDLLIVSKTPAVTKTNKSYFKVVVRDSSEEISGNLWDATEETFPYKSGDVLRASGKIGEYQGKKQITLDFFEPSEAPMSEFGRKSRFEIHLMWDWLVEEISEFQEPMTKYVAEELMLKQGAVMEQIKLAPAATSVHNNWYGGLLEHIWSLCTIAKPVINHYKERYAPYLSKDKVLFGLMLHDLGKIVEYDVSNPGFPIAPLGCLTNHMVLGPAWVYEKCNQYSKTFWEDGKTPDDDTIQRFKKERAHLMHILAAHHGQVEWGSPMKPATLEAILVHHFDNLDSKMLHAIDLIDKGEGNVKGFSERSYFERTGFLRSSITG